MHMYLIATANKTDDYAIRPKSLSFPVDSGWLLLLLLETASEVIRGHHIGNSQLHNVNASIGRFLFAYHIWWNRQERMSTLIIDIQWA